MLGNIVTGIYNYQFISFGSIQFLFHDKTVWYSFALITIYCSLITLLSLNYQHFPFCFRQCSSIISDIIFKKRAAKLWMWRSGFPDELVCHIFFPWQPFVSFYFSLDNTFCCLRYFTYSHLRAYTHFGMTL